MQQWSVAGRAADGAGNVGLARALLLICVSLPLACGNPYDPLPARTVVVTPQLAKIGIESWRMRDGGVIEVYGAPADSSFRLVRNERALVSLSSNAGELETLSLEPLECRGEDGNIFVCRGITIRMQDGVHVSTIEPTLNQLDVSLTLVSPSGRIGGAWIFANDTGRVREVISSWPTVKRVERNFLFELASQDAARYGVSATLIAVGWFRLCSPTPNNGVVEAMPGDTIRVSYLQPDGTVLADTLPK